MSSLSSVSCSGLDSSTSVIVISLLKQLADEGRTIICSIHQPSVRLYNLFDHLYAIADGQCIYSGATEMLIPFLSELDLICPKTYDPFDYRKSIKFECYSDSKPIEKFSVHFSVRNFNK